MHTDMRRGLHRQDVNVQMTPVSHRNVEAGAAGGCVTDQARGHETGVQVCD
jgi:hypothetical protein